MQHEIGHGRRVLFADPCPTPSVNASQPHFKPSSELLVVFHLVCVHEHINFRLVSQEIWTLGN